MFSVLSVLCLLRLCMSSYVRHNKLQYTLTLIAIKLSGINFFLLEFRGGFEVRHLDDTVNFPGVIQYVAH